MLRSIRLISAVAVAAVAAGFLLAVPASAQPGGISTSWGKFYCSRLYDIESGHWPDTTDTLHTRCAVTDRKKDGDGVYIQAHGVRSGPVGDTSWVRLTNNASGKGTTIHERPTLSAWEISYWELRLCRSQPGPDYCYGKLRVAA